MYMLSAQKAFCRVRFIKMLVEVTEGKLKGEKMHTSVEYFSFKGIPFAKPPVGPLRFKDPVPPEKYNGVWDATQERLPCIQKNPYRNIGGDEDCLYLNVFTPKLPKVGEPLKPVMFYIYEGGCYMGTKDAFLYGPDYLIAKDVILVVPNYRLHIFGYLNLGIDECPGNVGFKDQLAALKWTKANVSKFGGDPDNITIFGNSTGAVSVMFLLCSPLSRGKGLFHKAIIQSGTIMHSRSFGTIETSKERAIRVAKKLGFETKDSRELYNFLMKAPAQELATHALAVFTEEEKRNGEISPFLASVEIAGPANARMIVGEPSEIMKQDLGVPIMNGLCSQEGIRLLIDLVLKKRPAEDFVSISEAHIVPRLFGDLIKDEDARKKVIEAFKQFYFRGKSTDEEIIIAALDLYGDVMYSKGFHDSNIAILEHSTQPLYNYLFSFRANLGKVEFLFNSNRPVFLKGASHNDELGYLFNMVLDEDKPSIPNGTDKKIIDYMTTIWTNFAKYSDPGRGLSVDFKPITSTEKSYLVIDEKLSVKPGIIFEERMKFIDGIYASLSKKPVCKLEKSDQCPRM